MWGCLVYSYNWHMLETGKRQGKEGNLNACTYMNINRTNTYISINFLFIIPTSCFRFVHICYHKRLQTSLKEVLVTQFLYLFDTCITINVNMHCESTGRYIIVTKYTVIQRKNMFTLMRHH